MALRREFRPFVALPEPRVHRANPQETYGFSGRLTGGERFAPRVVASPAGFEPTAPRLGIWCSILLSYGDVKAIYRSGGSTSPGCAAGVSQELRDNWRETMLAKVRGRRIFALHCHSPKLAKRTPYVRTEAEPATFIT